jgi:adenylate cyclase class 2
MSTHTNTEIEARFLEVDKELLVATLTKIGATNKGEHLLSEVIFYDIDGRWQHEGRYARLRSVSGSETTLTYKRNTKQTIDSAFEVEFSVSDGAQAELFLEHVGLKASRHQEKRRHTFLIDDVVVDIDTWPNIPTYVEFEGPTAEKIQSVAERVGFSWKDAIFDDARKIIEERYGIPVGTLTWFTFNKTA